MSRPMIVPIVAICERQASAVLQDTDIVFSLPPGYTRSKPVEKPKLGPLLPVIAAILDADRIAPVKQRHTAKRADSDGTRARGSA